jgi:hypothetical protein
LRFPVKKPPAALLCGLLACALPGLGPAAPRQTERSKQKAAAEAQRAGIQQKLGALKKDISRTESEKEDAADEWPSRKKAISDANRALRELGDEQTRPTPSCASSPASRSAGATIAAQKKQLAKLLRQHYVAGNEDRIKLLLSGDNPNRINRDLQMMAYVSQAQAKLLARCAATWRRSRPTARRPRTPRTNWKKSPGAARPESAAGKRKGQARRLLANLSSKLATQRKEASKPGARRAAHERPGRPPDAPDPRTGNRRRGRAQAPGRRPPPRQGGAEAKARALAAAAKAAGRTPAPGARSGQGPASRQAARPPPERRRAEGGRAGAETGEPQRPADTALAADLPSGAFAACAAACGADQRQVAARFGAKRGDGPAGKACSSRRRKAPTCAPSPPAGSCSPAGCAASAT